MENLPPEIRPFDAEALRARFEASQPTRFFCIDGFLEEAFAHSVARSFPAYEEAVGMGHQFRAVQENRKVQITAADRFPAPVRRLSQVLAAPSFLEALEQVTGIDELTADDELSGGGMHVMGPGGRLDVHVDFNLIRDRGLYRRLNILVFFNEVWRESWGGHFELWDPTVRECLFSAAPVFNRCVVFNTTETSFHGVRPIRSPDGVTRNSFASYYYTRRAPEGATDFHTTLFRPRPGEGWRARVLLPLERWSRRLRSALGRLGPTRGASEQSRSGPSG